MQFFRCLPALALTIALAGCATGPQVRVDRDPAANFAAYRTFAFFQPLATDNARYSTLMTAHLKQATRSQLEQLGYVYDESSPDLRVNFHVRVADRQELRSSTPGYYGYRGNLYRGWNGYPQDLETVNYKAGTLTVDLVAAKTGSLVWQGVAEGRVREKVMRDPATAIDSAVGEIFRGFPGSAKANG
jgi:PBP1b-binding outer membrane lipoprotein LpoB